VLGTGRGQALRAYPRLVPRLRSPSGVNFGSVPADAAAVRRTLFNEVGQTMTEYAIVLSLVAVVVIAAVAALGGRVSDVLNQVTGLF
jgi:Flp pilus assembly pilin Flp